MYTFRERILFKRIGSKSYNIAHRMTSDLLCEEKITFTAHSREIWRL